jgi:hypothetical protein
MIVPSYIWFLIFKQLRLSRFIEAKSNLKTLKFINISVRLNAIGISPRAKVFVNVKVRGQAGVIRTNSRKRLVAWIAIIQ